MNTRSARAFLAPVLLLGLFFFACSQREQEAPTGTRSHPSLPDITVVATVNGDPITLGEFMERFARSGFRQDVPVDPLVKEEFLNRLIERKMILREAQRRRFKVGLAEINQRIEMFHAEHGKDVQEELKAQGVDFEKWKADLWEHMMIEKVIERDVNRHVSVSAAEIRRYYKNHQDEFTMPEQVRARQIVVSTESEAVSALEQIKKGSDFAALAKERSTAPEAARGGDLGYFARGEMPSEFNVVFGLRRGDVSGIVKTAYGFHIFKLEDRRPAGTRSVEEMSGEIGRTIRQEKQDARYQQWLRELRSRTKFEVNYQALAR